MRKGTEPLAADGLKDGAGLSYSVTTPFFALVAAAGDLAAIELNWGFFPSAVLFFGVIAVPLLGWRRFGLNPVVAFWAA